MQSPCKHCKDRKIGCHYGCDRYKEFVLYREQLRKKLAAKDQAWIYQNGRKGRHSV